jgi:hypothetical protein
MTVDHRTPESAGGKYEEKNLDCVCQICNGLKGSLTPQEFKKYLRALTELYELTKISLNMPWPLNLNFRQENYPGFAKKMTHQAKTNAERNAERTAKENIPSADINQEKEIKK